MTCARSRFASEARLEVRASVAPQIWSFASGNQGLPGRKIVLKGVMNVREEHLAMVGRGYEAFGNGDFDTLRELNDDDTVWRTPGLGPFKGEYKGADGVIQYLTQLFELSEGTIKVEVEHMYADEDRVVVLDHITASRHGKDIDFQKAMT